MRPLLSRRKPSVLAHESSVATGNSRRVSLRAGPAGICAVSCCYDVSDVANGAAKFSTMQALERKGRRHDRTHRRHLSLIFTEDVTLPRKGMLKGGHLRKC
jgi:hypothetical protein